MQWRGWTPKTRPFPCVSPCRIWSFCIKECRAVCMIKTEPQNWGALELRSLGMGGVADPKIHAPQGFPLRNVGILRYRVHSLRNPKHWGALEPLRSKLCVARGWSLNTSPPLHLLPCQIWQCCVKRCTHKYNGTPKLGVLRPCPIGVRAWLTPVNKLPPHMCYNLLRQMIYA